MNLRRCVALALLLALLLVTAGAGHATGLAAGPTHAGPSGPEPEYAGPGGAEPAGVHRWHGVLVQDLQAFDTGSAPIASGPSARAAAAPGAAPAAGAGAQSATDTRTQPATSLVLSNERTYTTWANPVGRASIQALPKPNSRRVGRLHMYTEDGFPEVYLLLAEQITSAGEAWIKLRIPARPNGQIGWVHRAALGSFHQSYWLLVVDRRKEQMTVYWRGRRRFAGPVGVGKPGTPTPPGHFWIRERFRVLDPSSAYWPYAMGTSDYSSLSEWPGGGVVGIHGAWGQPWLIPGDPSHGCIRMHNPDIAWIAPRVPVGTPLHVI